MILRACMARRGGGGTRRLASSFAVRSPRDGKIFSEIADWTASEVDVAVRKASSTAASPWAAASSVESRAASLRALATAVRRETERLSELETLDAGKPIAESRVDMGACVDLLEYYADIAPSVLREQPLELPDADFGSRVVPHAAGVVAAVTPWNYPLMQAVCKVAPALAAGCPVLLKPSPLASLTCLELGKLAAEECGLPEGALTVVTGGPPGGLGDGATRLISHPGVDFLSFTGSTRGGKEMLGASAPLVRRTGLELGGKSAMVVFDDASLADVCEWAQIGIFSCAGQICSATSRLLVHESVASELTERLREAAAAVVVADPLREDTTMGALISADARDRVLGAVASAHGASGGSGGDGATLVIGGASAAGGAGEGLEGGYYVQPTILSDVPLESAAWREEIFGPVLCIRTFETEAEAIRLANDSPYGLAHAVMSADEERCERVAAALDAGTVWINCSQPLWPQVHGWARASKPLPTDRLTGRPTSCPES
jgi:betaine-aldehyde dehydrogenase